MFSSVALVFEQDMQKAPAIRQSMLPQMLTVSCLLTLAAW